VLVDTVALWFLYVELFWTCSSPRPNNIGNRCVWNNVITKRYNQRSCQCNMINVYSYPFLYLFWNNKLLNYYFRTNLPSLQWTVAGVYGVLGVTVPLPVEEECKPKLDHVVHPVRPTMENAASGVLALRESATSSHVLVI